MSLGLLDCGPLGYRVMSKFTKVLSPGNLELFFVFVLKGVLNLLGGLEVANHLTIVFINADL